ncbi:hypothetical protein [Paenibacillus sp. DMB20]|uniref:hypothetical protein n=1 Tax=Paenibacillus sp. DMB20 TaxID=1642570 RepID=UPI0006281E3B|nr:hypothetical protein [Paenibacillus sp. DMB20]KKO52559.1 hypothetical protein XI25_20410 [Paenibacillus sp. DMB20]
MKKLGIMMTAIAIIGLIYVTRRADGVVEKMKQDIAEHAEKELRVPAYGSIVYTPLWIEYLREHPVGNKPVVGMFGPSTVYGTTVKESRNTTAGVLQANMKNKRVLNFGLSGARLTETYAILASVVDDIDVAVYEINYGILPATDNEPEVAVYPVLLSKLDQNIPRSWLDPFPKKDKGSVPSAVHNRVTTGILNQWTLYHDRDVLSYRYLKTRTPTEKLRRDIQTIRDRRKGIAPTYTPPFKSYDELKTRQQEEIVKHYADLYKWEQPFDSSSSFGLFMMGKTLDLLDHHRIQAVFYSAPLDNQLISERQLLNWNEYDTVMGAYRQLIESRGYPFIEFNHEAVNVVPHEYYHDTSHLIDKGSAVFGEILLERLKILGITDTP